MAELFAAPLQAPPGDAPPRSVGPVAHPGEGRAGRTFASERRSCAMRNTIRLLTTLGALASLAALAGAAEESFEPGTPLDGWLVEGPAQVDTTRDRGDGGGSLRIDPGGRAAWLLGDEDRSGTVDFWVYETAATPAEPETRLTGPYYGAVQTDGRVLAPGSFYAPYLSGADTYAVTSFNPEAGEESWFSVQYLGIPRTEGWHHWTITFDPEDGVTMLHDGTDVNAARERLEWHKTEIEGMVGVVFVGDSTPGGSQTLWVDDVSVTLGEPMGVTPEDQAPPPMTPESDPVPPQAERVRLVPEVRGEHPRLLFTAEDIPGIRAKIEAGYGKSLYDRMVEYLPACVAPDHTNFLTDATDGQRQGLWRLPTVALHYVLTGDETSFERTVEFMELLLSLENWETGELDSGMSSANIMIGAALAYDWLHDDLDEGFREAYRDKLLLMARRQYHQGHLMKLPGTHYWQGDPANNHRFHRNAGLTLAILAVAEEDETDDEWLLARTLEELRYVARWLPEDGSCHESPTYAVFGNTHLVLAMDAAQRCLGEPFLEHPFFRNAPLFIISSFRPDLRAVFGYGDSGRGDEGYHSFLHRLCAYHDLADEMAACRELGRRNESFYNFTWFSVIWWEPLEGGSIESLPRHSFFPDLGLAYMRTGWEASDVGAMFKCGPFGGYTLNEYRELNDMKYVNVAHDDPDANSFVLYADGELLAETDRYSTRKQSANHNTILINGAGQVAAGRPEGMGWSQPGGDMAAMGIVTAYVEQGDHVGIEGEAAGSYLANPAQGPERPALDRYRRAFLWVEDQYILVLDDIRAPEPVEITWLMQGPELEETADGYVLREGDAHCPFRVDSTQLTEAAIVDSPADNRGEPLGWRQLRLSATASDLRVASVYDPWLRGDVSVALRAHGPDTATVVVMGDGFEHTWQWKSASGRESPSTIVGHDSGGGEVLSLGAE
ncbi:MAG: DUF4962 domain-containing protein [Armatimonadia bacterium]|nr:DUF4962 domain-containing protein [Armatimonadia bacterium]